MTIWWKLILSFIVTAAAFTAMSGYAFTYATGIQDQVGAAWTQWWVWWWNWSDEPLVRWWLWVTGGPTFILAALLVATPLLYRPYGLVPAALPAYGLLHPPKSRSLFSRFFRSSAEAPVRSGTSNYGTARLMTPKERRRLWSGPRPPHGGIVVAEDHDPREDGDYFASRDKTTWGRGGTTKLLIDNCLEGSPHSLVVAGSRSGKSMEFITTLADTWRSSAVVLDPALEITPQRKREKTFEALLRQLASLARRHPVLMIFEDLHWADPSSR